MKKIQPILGILIVFLCFFAGSVHLYQKRKEILSAGNMKEGVYKEINSINPVIEYEGKKYRRNSYLKAVLIIGVDSAGNLGDVKTPGSSGQADGIFLIVKDTARDSMKILMIPRDTMTEITLTDLEGNILGKDVQHIALAYAYGDGREKSCAYLRKAVSDLLGGLVIDYYAAINTSTIEMLNDEIGGVPVYIETDELAHKDPELKKGMTVLLDGTQAEEYLRYRDISAANSAILRMERQKQYMEAYVKQLKISNSSDDQLVVRLMEKLHENIITDMDKNQYMDMAADFFAGGNLTDRDIYIVPGEGAATELYDEYHVDQADLKEMILKLFYREVN